MEVSKENLIEIAEVLLTANGVFTALVKVAMNPPTDDATKVKFADWVVNLVNEQKLGDTQESIDLLFRKAKFFSDKEFQDAFRKAKGE